MKTSKNRNLSAHFQHASGSIVVKADSAKRCPGHQKIKADDTRARCKISRSSNKRGRG